MASNEKKDLLIFGYAVGLCVPFIMAVKAVHILYGVFHWLVLIPAVLALMFAITKMAVLKPVYNVWTLIVSLGAAYLIRRAGLSPLAQGLWAVTFCVLVVTIARNEWIVPLHRLFMAAAHVIGKIVSTVVMTILFVLIFVPVGLALRVLKKDLLNEKIDEKAATYWIERDSQPSEPNRYFQQF